MIRRIAVTVAIATTIVLAPRQSEACSCARPPEPQVALARADAVFVAEIQSVVREGASTLVRARVKRAFKGVGVKAGKTVEIHTGLGGGDCGVRFTAGSSWLVYAHEPSLADPHAPKGLHAGLCSRTTELANAAKDLEALDAPKDAGAPSSASSASPPSPPPPPEPLLDAGVLMQDVDAAMPTREADAGRDMPASSSPPPGSKGCACDLASPRPSAPPWLALALAAALVAARRRRDRGEAVP
jgi:MYXO-CTERM domain-containing protein